MTQVLVWWQEAKTYTLGRVEGGGRRIRTRNPDDEPCTLLPGDGRVTISPLTRNAVVRSDHDLGLGLLAGWLSTTEASWRGGFYVDMTPETIVAEWCVELYEIIGDGER